jgi:hypothetical protein
MADISFCKKHTRYHVNSSKNLLVLKQQAILAVGMDGHCCTHLKGNDTANKAPHANFASKMDFSW